MAPLGGRQSGVMVTSLILSLLRESFNDFCLFFELPVLKGETGLFIIPPLIS